MAQEFSEMRNGFGIDLDEAWRKIISRQFPGEAARGFGELIQNFLDSHPSYVPWEDRLGTIESGDRWISIADFGTGLNRERLQLLLTLGGTDKQFDADKIGKFGIGFFSIFNPRLGTKRVVVTTKCEGQTAQLTFMVSDPEKRPEITVDLVEKPSNFSTKVLVEFDNPAAVRDCLDYARQYLNYYPCRILINHQRFSLVWERDKNPDTVIFKKNQCHGMINFVNFQSAGGVKVLCKYEFIMDLTFSGLVTSGHNQHYDLRDFVEKRMPFTPDLYLLVNCNNLHVTISRDSYYLDWAHHEMFRTVREEMLKALEVKLRNNPPADLVLANQYILRREIKDYLNGQAAPHPAVETLANFPVYPVNGKKEPVSMADLYREKSPDLPLFYAPKKTNLRWLGGRFRHDFIVLPERCIYGGGAPDFYDAIFETVFEDAVNLDTVAGDGKKINSLVIRKIIAAKDLRPKTKIVGQRQLTAAEETFLSELRQLLNREAVKKAIARNLLIKVEKIGAVLFDVAKGGLVSTGLFDESGRAFTPDSSGANTGKVMLGLLRNHSFVEHLIRHLSTERTYFALIFLANQLVRCQKQLVPHSPVFHTVKERLADEMRRVLMEELPAG